MMSLVFECRCAHRMHTDAGGEGSSKILQLFLLFRYLALICSLSSFQNELVCLSTPKGCQDRVAGVRGVLTLFDAITQCIRLKKYPNFIQVEENLGIYCVSCPETQHFGSSDAPKKLFCKIFDNFDFFGLLRHAEGLNLSFFTFGIGQPTKTRKIFRIPA